ncbi:MAG TPA: AI-2E family transporter [Conexibacter sp.]|nr:AI-2E family transporter [Conexibacter sp.]
MSAAAHEPDALPVQVPTRPEPAPRTVLRVVMIVLLVVAALYVLFLLRKPIGWLVLATFIAVALSGPVNLLSRHMRRGVAIAIAYLGLVLIPIGIGAIVVPPLVREVTDLAQNAPQYVQDAQDWVNKSDTLRKLDREYNIGDQLQRKAEELPTHLDDAASVLSSVGGTIVSSLFAAINILILSIFMVASGRRWIDWGVAQARPEHAPRISRALDRIGVAVGNYVGGALLQATIAGLTTFVVLTILGVPFAAPLAVVVGIFDLIPLVGATIAAVLVGLVTVFHNFPIATIVWAIWAVVYQQVENTVIQPQIQKRAVETHAFAVLVSVLFGATLFGIVGALLAIPFAASIQIALREWWDYRQAVRVEMPPGVDLPPPHPRPDEPPARLDLPPGVELPEERAEN